MGRGRRRTGVGVFLFFTFIGQLISSNYSPNAGTTFGISSCHNLTHGNDGNPSLSRSTSKVKTCQGDFFGSGMIHNAPLPPPHKKKPWRSARPLALSAKTQVAAPRCSACGMCHFFFFFLFVFPRGNRLRRHHDLLGVCTFGFLHVCSCGS